MQPTPFQISVEQSVLDDLEQRLTRMRWPDENGGTGWAYGTSPAYLRELVDYWKNDFDWRVQEQALNRFAQFKVEIDGVEIHFIHERAKGANARPLLLTHGWPDTFARFHNVIPMLTDPERYGGRAEDAFDVIVPSLPGFGFSERKTMTSSAVADLWAKLMTEVLGYSTFVAAGGDLGSPVTIALAHQHPDAVTAIHLTDVGYATGQEDPSTMSQAEQDFLNMAQWWYFTEGGYIFVQSTKPQSLAYGLNDSPVGLAAWIVSFINGGSDTNVADAAFGGRDALLTNIMIYWVTETAGSAARMYAEDAKASNGDWGNASESGWDAGDASQDAEGAQAGSGDWGTADASQHTEDAEAIDGGWGAATVSERSEVPAAIALFPGEAQFPREWAERRVNVQRFTLMPEGGHFAALEIPELYVQDLRDSFRELEAS